MVKKFRKASCDTKLKYTKVFNHEIISFENLISYSFKRSLKRAHGAIEVFKVNKDCLPNPNGSLSGTIPSHAIAQANRKVQQLLSQVNGGKRGPYKKYVIFVNLCALCLFISCRYNPKERLEIARYACHHGVTAAAVRFLRKLGHRIRESTVHSIKKAYLDEIKKLRARGEEGLDSLPHRKQGKPLLLGDKIDNMVQAYIRRVREHGGPVSSQIVIGAARGIVAMLNKEKLKEFGGHIDLNRHWALSLLHRMNFVQRKAATAKGKYSIENFAEKKAEFLDDLVTTVQIEDVPPELVLDWDQTGIKLVPTTSWTMNEVGARRVELIGLSDKRQITAVFCGSLVGEFLPVQLIYKGKTSRCHPKFNFPL